MEGLIIDSKSLASGPAQDAVAVPVTMHWLWAPLGLLLLLPVPALIGSMLIPESSFRELFGQPSFLDERIRLAALGYMLLYVVIAALVVPMSSKSQAAIWLDVRGQRWLDNAVKTLSVITFAAYAIWFGNALLRGLNVSTVLALVSGEQGTMYELRYQYFESLSGVTTWMQLASLAVPLAVLRSRAGGRSARSLIWSLLLLALVRALLNSERLALIEIVLALALATLILRPVAPRITRRPIQSIMLIIGAWAVLLLVFGAFEYFRSWAYARASFQGGFWEYAATLLLGYYATAINLVAFDASLLGDQTSMAKLFQGNLWEGIFGPAPLAGSQAAYGLETYTNRSGLVLPVVAGGTLGGILIVLATAAILAIAARWAARGHVVAFAFYCATSVAILELVRIYYLGESRFLTVIFATAILTITWSLTRTKDVSRTKLQRRTA